MYNKPTLLSLFDGSGGFPLASQICGIKPVAASEIERFPIAVTTKRFPDMKHLGDITKLNGAEIEPVDVITFGSPCQGLSIAGKGEGLKDERSGLFLEAIRIIKEMRKSTNGIYPTFIVWENVSGVFSSPRGNRGADFRTVLQEICGIADETVSIPMPHKQKWHNAGEIISLGGSMGSTYSVAWRMFNAQYWGVPQRRRRIYLVADFKGNRAGEVLFKREGLPGDFTQGVAKGKRFSSVIEDCLRKTGWGG